MAIIDYRKSIIHMTLEISTFDPLLNTTLYAKQGFKLFCLWQLQILTKSKPLCLKTSIKGTWVFFHYSLHLKDIKRSNEYCFTVIGEQGWNESA